MSRQLLIALGGGTSAVLSIAFMAGSPMMLVFANLAPLPLFFVGLGIGPAGAVVAGVVGLIISGAFGGLVGAGLYGLVHALPTWLAVRQALLKRVAPDGTVVWYSIGAVLSWLTALAAAMLIMATLTSYQHGQGLEQAVTAYLDQVMLAIMPNVGISDREMFVATLTPLFPSTAGISWIAVVVGNGLFAQAVLSRSGRNIRPSPTIKDFTLPDWMSWLLVACAAMALLGSGDLEYIGRNLAAIMAVPFFVLGAVVVHALARRTPSPKVLLVAFYLVLFVSGWARVAIAGLGLIEQWVGVRQRVAALQPLQEDE
ncbi:MAG: DUF2232 domain-containing protein [Rhodospirillales bacterium]|jgi:hypothetical protein|nr:DUF2232 domain-containing protein [Rhodospirillales bacterium]